MKTKQTNIKAKLPLLPQEIKKGAYWHDKEHLSTYKIIDKKTEKTIIDCRVSCSRSRNSSSVYCDLWISNILKIPKNADYTVTIQGVGYETTYNTTELSGQGVAGGYGYDKESSAVGSAISDCGVELYGSPYPHHSDNPNFKKRAYIGGTGCHESALLAIAYTCGYNNCILVKS